MPAWGAPGGGPLTDQQLDDLVYYLRSVQLSAEEWAAAVEEELEAVCAPVDGLCTKADPNAPGGDQPGAPITWRTEGEALFNLGYYSKFASGAAACARCHTAGWSYGDADAESGIGSLGPNLTNGRSLVQFPTAAQQIDFVSAYPKSGLPYGRAGISSGKMGSFGENPNLIAATAAPFVPVMDAAQVMLTPEQIAAVVAYERSL
jgi:hypothetical protein